MGDRQAGRYWCYMCSPVVNPTTEPEIQCPLCDSGFLEEVGSIRSHSNTNHAAIDTEPPNSLTLGSNRAWFDWFIITAAYRKQGPSNTG
ncbi:hypothetical protein J1N35_044134 [Gossypium stocksii]|uniref:RING-type E3 ubiquitin transferase n=1 Tax=Gossypium stocksii TaxID=47602 RepID=A0A9D3U8W9_9ROSI|nr:hypothetical protein J1N35_044134 [Gossypium stocksii]